MTPRTVLPGGLNWPLDLAVGDDGKLYVADGTYFYAVVRADGVAGDRRDAVLARLSRLPARACRASARATFVVTTSGGQITRYRPADERKRTISQTDSTSFTVSRSARDSIVVRRTRHGPRALGCDRGNVDVLASGLQDPVGVAFGPDGVAPGGGIGCGPRGPAVRLGRGQSWWTDCNDRRASSWPATTLYIVDAGAKEVIAFDLGTSGAPCIASGLPVGPPPGVEPKPLKGMPPFSGPQGPFAGITAGPDGTLYVSAGRRRQRAGSAAGDHMTVTPADHRYLQVARTLRKEIVDGLYPVGSQLPTEHELCERFAGRAATPFARRCAGCVMTTWSHRGPRAGTLVVPAASDEFAMPRT